MNVAKKKLDFSESFLGLAFRSDTCQVSFPVLDMSLTLIMDDELEQTSPEKKC